MRISSASEGEYFELLRDKLFLSQFYSRPLNAALPGRIDRHGLLQMPEPLKPRVNHGTDEQFMWCTLGNAMALESAKRVLVGTSSQPVIFERGRLRTGLNVFDEWRILCRTKVKAEDLDRNWHYISSQCTEGIVSFEMTIGYSRFYISKNRPLKDDKREVRHCTFATSGLDGSYILGKPCCISDDLMDDRAGKLISYWEYSLATSTIWWRDRYSGLPIVLPVGDLILDEFREFWRVEGLPGLSCNEWNDRDGQKCFQITAPNTTAWKRVFFPPVSKMSRPIFKYVCSVPIWRWDYGTIRYAPASGCAIYHRNGSQYIMDLSEEALVAIKREHKFKIYKAPFGWGRFEWRCTTRLVSYGQGLILECGSYPCKLRMELVPVSK